MALIDDRRNGYTMDILTGPIDPIGGPILAPWEDRPYFPPDTVFRRVRLRGPVAYTEYFVLNDDRTLGAYRRVPMDVLIRSDRDALVRMVAASYARING